MNTTGKIKSITKDSSEFKHVCLVDQEALGVLAWSGESWEKLDPTQSNLWVWMKNSQVLGFALFLGEAIDGIAHLVKIALRVDMRGTGEAEVFWSNLVTHLKDKGFTSVFLEVEATNLRAVSFYKKCGFNQLRLAKGFYTNGADALIMEVML